MAGRAGGVGDEPGAAGLLLGLLLANKRQRQISSLKRSKKPKTLYRPSRPKHSTAYGGRNGDANVRKAVGVGSGKLSEGVLLKTSGVGTHRTCCKQGMERKDSTMRLR